MKKILNAAKILFIALIVGCLMSPLSAFAQQKRQTKSSNTKATKSGNADHQHDHSNHGKMDKAEAAVESQSDSLKVTKVSRLPNQFVGNVIYSPEANRLWLLSFGPPANTKGPSVLFELDPATGKEIARASMPFLGEFGAPACIDNVLYVGIPYESKVYKVSLEKATLGKMLGTLTVPGLTDLKLNAPDEPYRFPFLNFTSVAASPEKNLILVADDTGYLVHIDRETGEIVKKTSTIKGLDGATMVSHGKEVNLLIGNQDPETVLLKTESRRFMFRARHGFTPPYAIRTENPCPRYGVRDINWVVVDGGTGEVLSSTFQACSRASAGSVSAINHESVAGSRYGKFTFYAIGDEGLVTVEWIPR